MGSRSSDAANILEQHFGAPTYLGTISGDGSTAKTAATTDSTPFTIPAAARIILQADVDVRWRLTPSIVGAGYPGAALVASTANSLKLRAGDERETCLRTAQNDVSVISDDGAPFECMVFRLD